MKLNFLERFFILNPVRPLIQRHLEARQLLKLGGSLTDGLVLEVGCGPGAGIDLLFDLFGATTVHAFDLDDRMVHHARRRHVRRTAAVQLWTGNVRHIPVPDGTYDAVFNFGALHHVVDWRAALEEIRRVLKPGGRFYCEEILKYYITHPFWGRLMKHPQADRFDGVDFVAALKHSGLKVRDVREMGNLYIWITADNPR
jgi:ubiquinone/menaquinone biosynthesis C-methylase UbiE